MRKSRDKGLNVGEGERSSKVLVNDWKIGIELSVLDFCSGQQHRYLSFERTIDDVGLDRMPLSSSFRRQTIR